MSIPHALDPDLLRAFVLIAEGRSFTRAAALLGRTQSAISMQVKRLEEQLGHPVLQRSKGGGVDLTSHGTYLLGRAREILALHDEVMATFRAPAVSGTVRLGTPDDYAFRYLPSILARFARSHPAVDVDVICAPTGELAKRLQAGELDLTLMSEGNDSGAFDKIPLWRGPLHWIVSARHNTHRQTPLPLALTHEHCSWRRAALRALDEAGRPYRVAYVSGSQVGSQAPVLAGLAVTVATTAWLPDGLRPLRADEGLPKLPDFSIVLVKGATARQPVTDALATHIDDRFRMDPGGDMAVAAE